jgi:hypothetical protein
MTHHWARLHFGGTYHRWHITDGPSLWAICGRQNFDYPRVERTGDVIPGDGKLCKYCLAKAAKEDRKAA